MRRWLGVVSAIFLSIMVGGCTVPVSVTVASWAIDGVSYLATKKSLTDHGISFISGQDCALHRAVTELDLQAVCQNYEDPIKDITLVADASDKIERRINRDKVDDIFSGFDLTAPAPKAEGPQAETTIIAKEISIEEIANFETAAGPADKEPSIEEIANFETASGGDDTPLRDAQKIIDQSDFEKLDDPEEASRFNLTGIWRFFKNIAD